MPEIYRIAAWKETFEKSDSRKLKVLTWVSLPVSFSSSGYQSMLDEFGDEAPAIYGAWCALACLASQCTVRGILADSRGIPLKTSWIARQTYFPLEMIERMMQWAASPTIGWLESITADEFIETSESRPDEPTKTEENTTPLQSTENPPAPPASPPRVRENPSTTRHNITRQDITQHHPTSPDKTTRSIDDGRMLTGIDLVTDEFAEALGDAQFVEEVRSRANKFLAEHARNPVSRKLDKAKIWRICWTSMFFDDGATIASFYEKLHLRQVEKPVAYIDTALRKLVATAANTQWELVEKVVPDPPPTSEVIKQRSPSPTPPIQEAVGA